MARIKIRDLQRAPDMAIFVLDHKTTRERQYRRRPPAVVEKYRQKADGGRDFDIRDAWQGVPGLNANWELVAWMEGVESVDSDTGWLEADGDFYQQANGDPEDLFFIWVPGETEPREYPLSEYTITRTRQGVTVTPNPPDIQIDRGFLIY